LASFSLAHGRSKLMSAASPAIAYVLHNTRIGSLNTVSFLLIRNYAPSLRFFSVAPFHKLGR
jgi:hypothetical protein